MMLYKNEGPRFNTFLVISPLARSVHPSGFVLTISCTIMHGFQNNLAQLLLLRRRSAILNIFIDKLKVKVTGLSWSYTCIELFRAIMGWWGGEMVLGKLPVPGRPTLWITVRQGPTVLTVGAGGG